MYLYHCLFILIYIKIKQNVQSDTYINQNWWRLSKNNWREQILGYEVKKSEVLYSDFSPLRLLLELEKKNQKNIQGLEEEYKQHLDQIFKEFEDSKKTADGLKIMYEEKLTQQEDEHETEIQEQNELYRKEIAQLNEITTNQKTKYEEMVRQNREAKKQKDLAEKKQKIALGQLEEKKEIIE